MPKKGTENVVATEDAAATSVAFDVDAVVAESVTFAESAAPAEDAASAREEASPATEGTAPVTEEAPSAAEDAAAASSAASTKGPARAASSGSAKPSQAASSGSTTPAHAAPKGLSDLMTRTITGVVYAVVFIGCLLLSTVSTALLLAVLGGLCAHEFYQMMRTDAKIPDALLGIVVTVLYPFAFLFLGIKGLMLLTVLFILLVLIRFVFFLRFRVVDAALTIFGALYAGLLPTALLVIRCSYGDGMGLSIGPAAWLTLAVVVSVWANDVFAYLVGSKIGKHKMVPRISPKKSWEGVIAGLVGGIIVWVLATWLIPLFLPYYAAVIIAVLCGVAGVIGDLTESRIKRIVGCKDSGNLLPGHGGFLDRCDSIIFVSPVAAILLTLFGIILL